LNHSISMIYQGNQGAATRRKGIIDFSTAESLKVELKSDANSEPTDEKQNKLVDATNSKKEKKKRKRVGSALNDIDGGEHNVENRTQLVSEVFSKFCNFIPPKN